MYLRRGLPSFHPALMAAHQRPSVRLKIEPSPLPRFAMFRFLHSLALPAGTLRDPESDAVVAAGLTVVVATGFRLALWDVGRAATGADREPVNPGGNESEM